jgi:hypothetical protein
LQSGIKVITVDLKTVAGQKALHRELAKTDVLITSFRPSAIEKLGLGWKNLHRLYPALSQVAIVGSLGARAEEPGHDLTYVADNGLVPGLELPATLYADMGGSLAASEAVLQAVLSQRTSSKGIRLEIALASAVHYLALPRHWGLTQPSGFIGGAHPGLCVQGRPCGGGGVGAAFCCGAVCCSGLACIRCGESSDLGHARSYREFFEEADAPATRCVGGVKRHSATHDGLNRPGWFVGQLLKPLSGCQLSQLRFQGRIFSAERGDGLLQTRNHARRRIGFAALDRPTFAHLAGGLLQLFFAACRSSHLLSNRQGRDVGSCGD